MNGRYRNITASILQIKMEFSFHYFMLKHFWGVPVIMIISNAFCKWTDKPVKVFKTVKDTSGVMLHYSPSVFNYYLNAFVCFLTITIIASELLHVYISEFLPPCPGMFCCK